MTRDGDARDSVVAGIDLRVFYAESTAPGREDIRLRKSFRSRGTIPVALRDGTPHREIGILARSG